MSYFFISDVHLRLDRLKRGERLARFVSRLVADDTLIVGGDLCDFWFASREIRSADECPGLRSLAEFRERGGNLILIPGNHDWWMGPFYADRLAARYRSELVELRVHGFRVHVVHGHQIETRINWKRFLESRHFLAAFSMMPLPVAIRLDWLLENRGQKSRSRRHRQLKEAYRKYVRARRAVADIFVFGHVHERVDEQIEGAQMVVLGDWEESVSYLRIDDTGASFIRED